jgi:adenosylhomocysteine nucleosidase
VKSPASQENAAAAPTLVCFALAQEAAPFRKKLSAARSEVAVLLTGIGRTNAERAVRDFLRRHPPRRVFTCGFCGGLDPQLCTGAVLFSTEDAALAAALGAAGARPASFACAARIAVTAEEKKQLWETTGAAAVDMESEFIHAVCREHQVPCATVRAISDPAWEDLPLDFNRLSNPDQSLNLGRLMRALAAAPGKLPALRRLQRQTRFAAQQLAAVLTRVV